MKLFTAQEIIHLLGASQSDLVRLLGVARVSLNDLARGKARLPKKSSPIMADLQSNTRAAYIKVARQRKKEVESPKEDVLRLKAIYFRQEAMLIQLRDQLTIVNDRYAQATQALALLEQLQVQWDASEGSKPFKLFIRNCQSRMKKREKRNGFAAQLTLQMRIAAAEAEQKLALELLQKMGAGNEIPVKKSTKKKKNAPVMAN